MIRIAFATAFALGIASAAFAQQLTVRSGEHEGYTRLVVQIPARTEWEFAQTKNGAQLKVDLADVTFSTASVFQRLTQNRLSAISQKNPGDVLELQFGCECAASSFLYQDTMIVVDIAPATKLPPIDASIPPPILPKVAAEISTVDPERSWETLPLPLLNLNARSLENQLSAQVLKGADRSLVDLNLAPLGPRSSLAQNVRVPQTDLYTNINVTSVFDELDGLLGPDVTDTERPPVCVSDTELGFNTWSSEAPFSVLVAAHRSALFQEFDTVDRDSALKLAKLYTYHGFGAEALDTLELSQLSTAETHRVSAIAQYLDHGQLSGENPFQGLQRCDGDVALWAMLTEGELSGDANLNRIEQTFTALPAHLRRHLGPKLSDILVSADKLEAAQRVLRAVDRIEASTSAGVSQAKATVATAKADGPKAEKHLADAINAEDADKEAPLAMARLVEKRWMDRGSVSPQELGLAAAFAVEHRKSDMHPTLMRAHAVALSLNNEFDAALGVAGQIPIGAEREAALNRVIHLASERANDVTFLRRALTLSDEISAALSTTVATSVSARLAKLGFPQAAYTLANRSQDKQHRAERAQIRAKASLLQGRPHRAMLELENDTSEGALQIKSQAMMATGDLAAAAELLNELADVGAADRLFWLADQPDRIAPTRDTKFGEVNRLSQKIAAPPPRELEKPLADARILLQDSADARQTIAELLNAIGP